MWWAWGPGGGGVYGAVAPFVIAWAACGGVGSAGDAGGVVVGGAVVGVGVLALVSDRAWAWGRVRGGAGQRPRDLGGAVLGGGVSRLVAGALGSPVLRPGGLRQSGWGCGLALAVALWMRLAGRGEEGMEDVEKDETEEEVVVLGDARCAAMRAGAALRSAAASAVATAGRMEGFSSGCGYGAGGSRGPAANRCPVRPIWSAAVRGGGVGLRSLPSLFR